MVEAGYSFLAELMLWLIYIVMGVAIVATVVSYVRFLWLNK